jgi:amphi-Trp domain-containing protein
VNWPIEGGEVTLKQGSESLTIALPHNLVLELKVETEDMEVEIEWYEGDEAET